MTIGELVLFNAMLMPTYTGFIRKCRSEREAGLLYLEWLAGTKKAPVSSKIIQKSSQELHDLLALCLLNPDPKARFTCAEALSHAYLGGVSLPRVSSGFMRSVEESSENASSTSAVWLLSPGGDPKEPAHWMKRDMWLTPQRSLCYFCASDMRCQTLMSAGDLSSAVISPLMGDTCRDHAFQITSTADGREVCTVLAATTANEMAQWKERLSAVETVGTMHLGPGFHKDVKTLQLAVTNRRLRVQGTTKNSFTAVFRAPLWKVKSGGDAGVEGDWMERDMWLAKNGNLVYWSVKEDVEMIYYTAHDLVNAHVRLLPAGEAAKTWVFSMELHSTVEGVEFKPTVFAAETEELRDQWVSQIADVCQALRDKPAEALNGVEVVDI